MIPTIVDMNNHHHKSNGSVNIEAGRTARSTSIDVNAGAIPNGLSPRPLQAAFEKLNRRSKSFAGPASSNAGFTTSNKFEHKLVWRERKSEVDSRRTRWILHKSIPTCKS